MATWHAHWTLKYNIESVLYVTTLPLDRAKFRIFIQSEKRRCNLNSTKLVLLKAQLCSKVPPLTASSNKSSTIRGKHYSLTSAQPRCQQFGSARSRSYTSLQIIPKTHSIHAMFQQLRTGNCILKYLKSLPYCILTFGYLEYSGFDHSITLR
jgi:hypothetical protein